MHHFVKLPVTVFEQGLISKPDECLLFNRILIGASHPDCYMDRMGVKVHVKHGEYLTSVRQIVEEMTWSANRVQRWLDSAADTRLVIVKPVEKRLGTILSVRHWWGLDSQTDTPTDTRSDTPSNTPTDTPSDTQNKILDLRSKTLDRREREPLTLVPSGSPSAKPTKLEKPKHKYAKMIFMTEEEHSSLVVEFGPESVAYNIESASLWMESNGRQKKSHSAFVRNWIRKAIAEQSGFYSAKIRNGYTNGARPAPKTAEQRIAEMMGSTPNQGKHQ